MIWVCYSTCGCDARPKRFFRAMLRPEIRDGDRRAMLRPEIIETETDRQRDRPKEKVHMVSFVGRKRVAPARSRSLNTNSWKKDACYDRGSNFFWAFFFFF